MRLYKLLILLSGLTMGIFPQTNAQNIRDSLVTDRQNKLQEYTQYKNNMEERTWVNLIDLGQKANALISADNELIHIYLDRELARRKELSILNDKLILDTAIMRKEAEKRSEQLNEYQYLTNLFLLIILGVSIAFILAFIFLIDRHKKYKEVIYELERFWSMDNDQSLALKEKERELRKHLRLLEIENTTIQKEFILMSDQRTKAKKKLEEEIVSRRKAEQNMKDLIGQMKKE